MTERNIQRRGFLVATGLIAASAAYYTLANEIGLAELQLAFEDFSLSREDAKLTTEIIQSTLNPTLINSSFWGDRQLTERLNSASGLAIRRGNLSSFNFAIDDLKIVDYPDLNRLYDPQGNPVSFRMLTGISMELIDGKENLANFVVLKPTHPKEIHPNNLQRLAQLLFDIPDNLNWTNSVDNFGINGSGNLPGRILNRINVFTFGEASMSVLRNR
ncbi:hypothetical protein HYT02_03300 [Candidatus Gottesmanbacteria bacterium]|nr:hypothetical protein [Candidatus Gottesmanbacteria bacterium]